MKNSLRQLLQLSRWLLVASLAACGGSVVDVSEQTTARCEREAVASCSGRQRPARIYDSERGCFREITVHLCDSRFETDDIRCMKRSCDGAQHDGNSARLSANPGWVECDEGYSLSFNSLEPCD